MPRERTYRRQNDAQDAVLLGWVLILGVVGILYFLAYDRLHVRAGQLVEITIYPLLVAVFAWEALRYKATKTAKMEAAWPRPIPYCHASSRRRSISAKRASETQSCLVTTSSASHFTGATIRARCSRTPSG